MVNISYYSSIRLYKAVIDFQNLLENLDLIQMPCPSWLNCPSKSRHWAVEEQDLFPTRLLAAQVRMYF